MKKQNIRRVFQDKFYTIKGVAIFSFPEIIATSLRKGRTIAVILFLTSFTFFQGCKENDKSERVTTNSEKTAEWYKQPMRIAALQCNFNEDNMEVIDKWVNMGFNVEQLFHITADNYSSIYKPKEHKKILTEYVKKAHEKNLKIILYLNVHILGPSVEHNKAIWSQRDQNDSIIYMYETYPTICLNSSWKDYFFTVLDSLKAIDIDGIFLDGPVVKQNGCYCGHCQKKYKELFNSELNPDSKHLWEFKATTRDDFLRDAYDYWKKDNPEKIFYYNFPLLYTKQSYVHFENELKYNDILGTEGGFMFYGAAKDAFLWRPSLTSKLLEAVAPEKPRVIFMAADYKPWNWWLHSPLETKLCIASVYANDANVWYGLHGSTKLMNTPSADAAKEVLQFYKKNEDLLFNTRSAAKIGILYSFGNVTKEESDFVAADVRNKKAGDAVGAIRGYYSMLTESQIPFDLISDFGITSEKLKKFKVIIIPNIFTFDKNTENVIREFVGNGGVIIAELGASLYNYKGDKNNNFSLSDVLGISTSGEYSNHAFYNYFEINPESKFGNNIDFPMIPLPLLSLDISLNDNTEVLAEAIDDLAGRYVPIPESKYPFMTSHKFGKGEAIYFTGSMGEMYNEYHVFEYKRLVGNIISDCLKDRIEFENAPTNLEVVLREQEERMILHLINYQAGPTRPFEKLTPVSDLKIKIPEAWKIKKVYSCGTNSKLKSKRNDGKLEFTLPELNEYEILVLER